MIDVIIVNTAAGIKQKQKQFIKRLLIDNYSNNNNHKIFT